MSLDLRKPIPAWKRETLAARLEHSRILLLIHGYLRDSESERIKQRIHRDWEASAPEGATDR